MKSVQNEIYCPLMWQQVATTTEGNFRPCCNFQWKEKDEESHFSQGWNNIKDILQPFKEQMNKGIKIKECNHCWDLESKGQDSTRTIALQSMKETTDTIKRIDYKLGNLCNLGCRMCEPFSSTVLQNEVLNNRHLNWLHADVLSADYDYNKQNWFVTALEQALEFPELDTMKFTGGEPFSIPEVQDFLEKFPRKETTTVQFVTNALLINNKRKEILKKFKKVHLTVSCDGIGDVYDYVRWPGKWEKFEEKYLELINEGFDITLAITVSAFNIYYMPEILDYFYKKDQELRLVFVTVPWYCQPWVFPKELKNKIKDKFKKYPHLADRYEQILAHETEFDERNYKIFLEQKLIKDKLRKQEFDIFGELHDK